MLKYKITITFSIYKYIAFFSQQPVAITSTHFFDIPFFTIFSIDLIFFALYRLSITFYVSNLHL